MMRILLSLLVTLIAASCGGPRYVDYFPYHDDGKAKPAVAVVPVLVPCEVPFASELSRELTGKIRFDIMNDAELFLFSEGEVQRSLSKIRSVEWLCSNEELAQNFCEADFVFLAEVIHTPVHPNCGKDPLICQHNFLVKMRIKVVDVRPRCPRVVLQEIMTGDYVVPCSAAEITSGILEWNPETYQGSALWRANQRLVSCMVKRVEEVIKCAY